MCMKFQNMLENQIWHWKISQKKWKDLGNLQGELRQQQPSCREVPWNEMCWSVDEYTIVNPFSKSFLTNIKVKFEFLPKYVWWATIEHSDKHNRGQVKEDEENQTDKDELMT